MREIWAIAINTFREAVRDKILYTLLAFALVMIGTSTVLGWLSIGQEIKIIKDIGLACIAVFGSLIAIFIGIGLVYKEIDRRTIYTIMAKPIHRFEFLLGKYLGLALTLFVNVGIMAAGLLALAWVAEGRPSPRLLLAVAMSFLGHLVLTAVAIFFSTFTTPTMSAIFSLSIFVMGSLSENLRLFASQFAGPALRRAVVALYYALPNLSNFDVKGAVVHGQPVPGSLLAFSVAYAVAYCVMMLLLSIGIFERRDFK